MSAASPRNLRALVHFEAHEPARPTAAAAAPGGEIRSLNTVRGIAALMVAGYHAPLIFGVQQQLPHAYLAVDLFFVLSGFVMAHVYAGRIEGGMSAWRFGQLRMARLYPLLALATLAGLAVWTLKAGLHKVPYSPQAFADAARNLVFLPADSRAYSPDGAAFPFLGQSWSIVWELAACAMFYVWVRFVRRGAALIALAAAIALGVIAGLRGTVDGGWTFDTFWIGAVRALFAFWAGVTVRRLVNSRLGRPAPRALSLAAVAATGALLVYVVLVPHTLWLFDLAAAVLAFPLLIAACALSRSRLLENRLGDVLGAASYSVYMLHGLAIDVTVTGVKVLPPLPHLAAFAFGLVWMAGLVAGSWLSWRWVETPLRKLFSRPIRWPSRSDQGATAVA